MVQQLIQGRVTQLAIIDNDEISRNEFGYGWGAGEVTITNDILELLKDGTKTLAYFDGEYVTFFTVGKENKG